MSSKVIDIWALQQLGGFIVVPLFFMVILASTSSHISTQIAIGVSAALTVAEIAFFYLSKAIFKREYRKS